MTPKIGNIVRRNNTDIFTKAAHHMCKAISKGNFGFPAPALSDKAKGTGSWKFFALGTAEAKT